MRKMMNDTQAQEIMHEIMGLDKPSKNELDYWLYAYSPLYQYKEMGKKVGKWLLWVKREDVDEVWERIKKATEVDILGVTAKVSTTRPNRHAKNPNKHVICVYTCNHDHTKDVFRVRNELRGMKFIAKIPYKTDATTLAGIYGKGSALYYA